MTAPSVRRADFLMALAYATDLATGHSRDFALRSCVLAMRLAEVAGLDDHTRRTISDAPPAELAKAVERGLAEAMQVSVPILSGHCEVAQRIAERIGLSDEICENLGQLYERWDGKGLPRGLSGNAVKLPVRLVTLAQDAIALAEAHGFKTMTTMIAKRA